MRNRLFLLCFKMFKIRFATVAMKYHKGEMEKEKQKQRATEELMLASYLGKPVIHISNEWENPIIGIATDIIHLSQNNDPRLVVHDYIEDQSWVCNGKVYHYNERMMELVHRFNPFDLATLIYDWSDLEVITKAKNPDVHINSLEESMLRLKFNGFYEALEEYEAERNTLAKVLTFPGNKKVNLN